MRFRGRWLGQVSDWAGSSVEFNVQGTSSLQFRMGPLPKIDSNCDGVQYFLSVWLDGTFAHRIAIKNMKEGDIYTVIEGLDQDQSHTIQVVKITEGYLGAGKTATCGPWSLGNVLLTGNNPRFLELKPSPTGRKILFIGASITVGYGVDGVAPCDFSADTENNDHSHTRLLSNIFGVDEYHVIAWSGKGIVKNNGEPT